MHAAFRLGAVFGAIALLPAEALAQEEVAPPSCSPKAALYGAEKGVKVWVTRRGALEHEHPLRPLTPERLVVLQVIVNGRLATAYGPDYDNLRQGGAPPQLERDVGAAIAWEPAVAGLPAAIRVVAADGSTLVGPIRFAECADAPAAKAAPARRPEAKAGAERRPAGREPPGLPQGATPGLSLPGVRPD